MMSPWRFFFYLGAVAFFLLHHALFASAATSTLEGRIVDVHGTAVSGAEVYIYRTENVKKPADFVSSKTGADGLYKVVLPPGSFFGVAIFRKRGNKFGPLESGDKHSGEPLLVEVDGKGGRLDFEIMDLREAARKAQKRNEEVFQISGTLLDESGDPLVMAYAVADKYNKPKKLPRYISAWSDSSGAYSLFLPKGNYFVGGHLVFPSKTAYILHKEINLQGDLSGVDIVVKDR